MSNGNNETHRTLQGTLLDESTVVTLSDLCRACGVHAELVIDLVEEGVIEPVAGVHGQWRFSATAVTRVQKALHLHRDLGVNWPGAALALDLLEQIERLQRDRRRLRRLEQPPRRYRR